MARRVARLVDVATEAGVGTSVVSRVLNGDPTLSIRDETRQRIVNTARRLEYRPNGFARGLKLARTMTIGLVINLGYSENANLIAAVERAAAHLGYMTLLADASEFISRGGNYGRLLMERRVDGLLMASGLGEDAFRSRAQGLPTSDRGGQSTYAWRRSECEPRRCPGDESCCRAPHRARTHQDRVHRRPAGKRRVQASAGGIQGCHTRCEPPRVGWISDRVERARGGRIRGREATLGRATTANRYRGLERDRRGRSTSGNPAIWAPSSSRHLHHLASRRQDQPITSSRRWRQSACLWRSWPALLSNP